MYISPIDIKTFQAIFLLDLVSKGSIKTVANGSDAFLEPLLIEMMAKDYIKASGINYSVTPKGTETLDTFMKRYTEYLKLYDVFSFIDLDKGEFAFSKYFDFATDDAWDAFKKDPRFEDLRIAVAIFKKLNPTEIVFMSFINEGRFDTSSTGWQMDILSSAAWNEIEEICKTALKPEQLGEDAMKDMIGQGTKIAIDLIAEEAKKETEARQSQLSSDMGGTQTVVEETIVEEGYYYDPYYYEAYYDPFYVSPFWLVPLFLW